MTDESKKRAGSFAAAKEAWLKLVCSYPNLSGSDMAVAVMLSTYMNSKRGGDAWPSVRRLADDTRRNPGTVWRSLRKLEKLELIAVVHGRGRHKPNHYKPALGALDADPRPLRRKAMSANSHTLNA